MSTVQRLSVATYPATRSLTRKSVRQSSYWGHAIYLSITQLDRILRRCMGIFEFSGSPDCLLRVAISRAKVSATLPSGTGVPRGTPIFDLHLWNEHIAIFLSTGSPLGRAKRLLRSLPRSFELLADYVAAHPEISAPVVHARVVMPVGNRLSRLEAVARAYGFTVTAAPARGLSRLHDYFEDYLVDALLWAFNPTRKIRWDHALQRRDLWIDRERFLARYSRYRPLPRQYQQSGEWREAQLCPPTPSVDSERDDLRV
jgi:hypothetical protein